MNEIPGRRRRLFSGAAFSSALFYSGDGSGAEGANFGYFAGCRLDGAYLALKRNGGVLLANEMVLSQAKRNSPYPVRLLGRKTAPMQVRAACGRGKTGVSLPGISAARYLRLKKNARLSIVDAEGKIAKIRGRKSAKEVKTICSAAKAARKILEGLGPWESKDELSLALRLKSLALEAGCDIAFEPIVATGRNSALPHHKPSAKKLDDFVLVDFGVKKEDYCSDFTFCYFRGRKGLSREREAYGKAGGIFERLLEGLPDCEDGNDVAVLAEKLIRAAGFPSLIHSIGHGIGLEVHECPRLGQGSGDSLDGAVIALEPAAYFSDFGVRFERMAANVNGKWKEI